MTLNDFTAWGEKQATALWYAIGSASIAVIFAIDVLTGYEIALSLFYLVPIAMLTWLVSRTSGLVASFACALLWLVADFLTQHPYSHPAIYYWNAGIRLGFFLVVASLITGLRQALRREQELSRTDHLTGAANLRSFTENLDREIERARRYKHPFTVVHLDLDNFKTVNDQSGHPAGDALLQAIVRRARLQLRYTDAIARLGGDEFGFLLPETGRPEAQSLLTRLHAALLADMQAQQWPVTFSIGVLTCERSGRRADEVMALVDQLTYAVKREGKNAIHYASDTD